MVLVIGIYPKKRGGAYTRRAKAVYNNKNKKNKNYPKAGQVIKQKVSTYRTSPRIGLVEEQHHTTNNLTKTKNPLRNI